MIIDKRENLKKYITLYPEIEKIIGFLSGCEESFPEKGSYPLSGERCIANVNSYATSDAERPFEVHDRYIDVMTVLEGEEILCFAPESALTLKEDCSASDYRLLDGEEEGRCILNESNFALILPGEAHKSGINVTKDTEVKKIVFKLEK